MNSVSLFDITRLHKIKFVYNALMQWLSFELTLIFDLQFVPNLAREQIISIILHNPLCSPGFRISFTEHYYTTLVHITYFSCLSMLAS